MKWDGSERRGFVRVNVPCKIIINSPQKHIISTNIINISAGGIRILISEKLTISSIVDLEMRLNSLVSCKGKVLWVINKHHMDKGGDLLFDTGIEFYEIKEEERHQIKDFVVSITMGTYPP